jgi:hypothetical protein
MTHLQLKKFGAVRLAVMAETEATAAAKLAQAPMITRFAILIRFVTTQLNVAKFKAEHGTDQHVVAPTATAAEMETVVQIFVQKLWVTATMKKDVNAKNQVALGTL